MSDEELMRAYDTQMREDPPAAFGQRIGRSSTVVRTRGRYNTILFSRIEPSDVAWKVFAHDVTSSLVSSLGEPETLMVRDLTSQDDFAIDVSEFQFRPVTTRPDVDANVAVARVSDLPRT